MSDKSFQPLKVWSTRRLRSGIVAVTLAVGLAPVVTRLAAAPGKDAPAPRREAAAATASLRGTALSLPGVVLSEGGSRAGEPGLFQDAAALRRKADDLYAEQSFRLALEAYRQYLAAASKNDSYRPEAERRIVRCLLKTKQWNEAMTAAEAFVKNNDSSPLWKARALDLIGEIYLNITHQAWKVGDRIIRGEDYPKVTGSEQPQRIWRDYEDRMAAIKAWEQAVGIYEGLNTTEAKNEHASVGLRLGDQLAQDDSFYPHDPEQWKKYAAADWNIKSLAKYDPAWLRPKKILTLYRRVAELTKDDDLTADAALHEANYVAGHKEQWKKRDPQTRKVIAELPIARIDPAQIVETAARRNARSKRAPDLLFAAAAYRYAEGSYVVARKLAKETVDRYAPKRSTPKEALSRDEAGKQKPPYTRWEYDTRALIEMIEAKNASVQVTTQPHPDEPLQAQLTTHNLKEVRLELYRVNLAAWLQDRTYTASEATFDSIGRFGDVDSLLKKGERLNAWTVKADDRGDYVPVVTPLPMPDPKSANAPKAPLARGTYLLALTADNGKIRAVYPLNVTDLALVRRLPQGNGQNMAETARALYYVANAKTGEPVAGATVQARTLFRHHTDVSKRFTRVQTGTTDAKGVLELPLWGDEAVVSGGVRAEREEALVFVGDDRMAVYTDGTYYQVPENRGIPNIERRMVGYTDRSLYRPKQTVHYRLILTQRERSGDKPPTPWEPRATETVKVVVNSPKNEKIYEQTLSASKFGTVNGTFTLPPGAPLGEWYVQAEIPGESYNCAFRVEEYRKPEFQATVKPVTEGAELGQEIKASVKATYFYGAPVTNGRVTYKVFRYPIYDYSPMPIPYTPYVPDDSNQYDDGEGYGGRGYGRYGSPYYFGGNFNTPITQGTVTTDAEGNAMITFKAEPLPNEQDPRPEGKRAYTYRVEAEVMDSARRVVEAGGTMKAADRSFVAKLAADRGFYEASKGVTVAVSTEDVYGKGIGPDKVTGATATLLEIERRADDSNAFEEKPRGTVPVTIGADGKASVRFSDLGGGVFKIKFEGKDVKGRTVEGESVPLFVHGPRDKGFPQNGPRLLADDRSVSQGDTLRLMISLPDKDAYVLLTQETGLRSVVTQMVKVDGYSAVVEMPTRVESVPNVRITATIVENYTNREAATGVTVKRSLARTVLSVKPGKEAYRPGELGTMVVKATDTDGKPVAAEVSLSVFDASLLAILPDRTPQLTEVFARDQYRYIYTNTAYSLQYQPQPVQVNTNPNYFSDGGMRGDMYYSFRYRSNGVVSENSRGGPGGFGGGMAGFGAPPPSAAPKAALAESVAMSDAAANKKEDGQRQQTPPDAPATVRKNLADLAFWTPAVVTDAATGEATVTFTFPDNLTEWQMEAAGLTEKVAAGNAEGSVVTDKKLTVRLAAPRFFVERDTMTLSAVVRNDLATEQTITVKLDADPTQIGFARGAETKITLKPKSEGRVEFPAKIIGPGGNVTVRCTALSPGESDAVEQTFPALAYGVQKMLTQAGTIAANGKSQTITFDIPKDHKAGSAALLVTVQPGLASTMLDALPYLADYPYGCVEQTMSRFLPAVLVSRALQDSGADLNLLRKRAAELKARYETDYGFGQKNATNSFTDQTGYTYPAGRPNSLQVAPLAEGLHHTKRWENPVFDAAKLAEMQQEGMNRLLNAQRSDGGWGWWPGAPSYDSYMSAYVMYGLASAKKAGVMVPDAALNRGWSFLEKTLTEDLVRRKDWHEAVWTLYSLSLKGGKPSGDVKKAMDGIFAERASLTVYGKSLLTLAMNNYGDDRSKVMSRNLRDAFEIDKERGTATPVKPAGVPWYWWRWYCDDEESVAWALRAFTAVKDDKSGADELSPLLVRYLVDKKRGSIWSSTKSTALIVHAMAEYLKESGELAARSKVTVALKNGGGADKMARTFEFTPETALLLDREFVVPTSLLSVGKQTVTITREGTGKVYWSAACQFVTQEEKITGVGDALQVNRRYFRLMDGGKREELTEGAFLRSGDKIEVEMRVTAKNELDYVIFEDMKPAGYEPLEQLSGFAFGEGLWAHTELRDTKVAFFITHMPRGTNVLRYRLRAETPGQFHALPTNGYAMYAPDVRALSDSETLTVKDVVD